MKKKGQRHNVRPKPKKKKVHDWCEMGGKALIAIEKLATVKNEAGEIAIKNSRLLRCPACNKRLTPKIIFCVGGEEMYQTYPEHKTK